LPGSGTIPPTSEGLLYLLQQGVRVVDAARWIEEAAPGFNASAEIQQRLHGDMAAWRAADVMRRLRLNEEFRPNRGSEQLRSQLTNQPQACAA
jgi:hypothetical protein